jgi:hypothetical protein
MSDVHPSAQFRVPGKPARYSICWCQWPTNRAVGRVVSPNAVRLLSETLLWLVVPARLVGWTLVRSSKVPLPERSLGATDVSAASILIVVALMLDVWLNPAVAGEFPCCRNDILLPLTLSEMVWAVTVADPVAPVGPVAPAGPVGPVAPVGPVWPVGPVGPVAPAGPVGPVGPVAPVGPVWPVGPAGPVAPAGPVGPVAPVGPV